MKAVVFKEPFTPSVEEVDDPKSLQEAVHADDQFDQRVEGWDEGPAAPGRPAS